LCREQWPDNAIHVITSYNRANELKTDPRVGQVLSSLKGTVSFAKVLADIEPRAASIVIPIGNQRGGGYGNVFQAIPRNAAHAYFLVPYCQTLQQTSYFRLQLQYRVEQILAKVCFPVAHFWTKQILKDLK